MAAITASGEDVRGSIEGRYGNTSPWRAMFGEKQLIHGLCAWAFTGTWSLDVTSFFDQNFSVPLDSQAMLYPCERRFLNFDPSSSPRGKATYEYHVGTFLMAGADLVNVHMDLECTDGICDKQDGYPTGRCDCRDGKKSTNIGSPEIIAQLEAGEYIDADIYVNHPSPRYDQVSLYWSYIPHDSSSPVTKNATCKIKQVGAEPFAHCQYSLTHMMFLCDYGGDSACTGYFYRDPYVSGINWLPAASDTGDKNLKITVPIAHEGSESSTTFSECTKWVSAELKQGSRLVAQSTPQAINYDGREEIEIDLGEIKDSWFSVPGGLSMRRHGTGDVIGASDSLNNQGFYRIKPGVDCVRYASLNDCNYATQKPTQTPTVDGTKIFNTQFTSRGSYATCDQNTFRIAKTTSEEWSECIEIYSLTGSTTTGCTNDLKSKDFTVEVKLFDAVQEGTRWKKSETVTRYDEGTQGRTLDFKLYCKKEYSEGSGSSAQSTSVDVELKEFIVKHAGGTKYDVSLKIGGVTNSDVSQIDLVNIDTGNSVKVCGGTTDCTNKVSLVSGAYFVKVTFKLGTPHSFNEDDDKVWQVNGMDVSTTAGAYSPSANTNSGVTATTASNIDLIDSEKRCEELGGTCQDSACSSPLVAVGGAGTYCPNDKICCVKNLQQSSRIAYYGTSCNSGKGNCVQVNGCDIMLNEKVDPSVCTGYNLECCVPT